jgi:hypothetical protein
MKFLCSLILLLSLSTSVNAQTALDEQIALTRQNALTDRKSILLDNVKFSADESTEFWPAWNAYRAEVAANNDRSLSLIKDFAANYENMTDQKASELMTDFFSIEMQNLVIKQKFSKDLSKFMPAQKVMRVIQVENKLDAAIHLQVAAEIPLTR